jgi:signal transduction histidine kinase/putative methionine-R-sulfoxide reductase with GAF domain
MAVGSTDELEELLTLIVGTTTEVLEAERATLYLLDDDGRLVSRVKKGSELQEIVLTVGQGIAGQVAKTGRAVRVRDAYDDPRFDREWDERSGFRTRAILAVPVKGPAGETIGVLQVLNKTKTRRRAAVFTPYDTEMLVALASQAAVSIEKANLFAQLKAQNEELARATVRLERTNRDLELLYELETKMARADTVPELARSVITLTAVACDAAAGALLHEPAGGGGLMLYVVNLAQPNRVREVAVQPGEGIAARALDQGELLNIGSARQIRDPLRVRELLGLRVWSAIAAPLMADGQATGALALYNYQQRPCRFSDEDAGLLRLVSANVQTELMLIESRRERERAERLGSIGKLLSGVMHDLRTPLSVISGYMQLMAMTDERDQRAEQAKTVAEQFEVIGAMQRDLLAYARGETPLLVRKVYLGRLCEAVARQFAPELQSEGIELALAIHNNGVGYFDERNMMRAIGNLIRNAIEAMQGSKKRKRLTLATDREGDDLILSVSDTGPGIPKRIRSKLFEPFVTSGKKTGTGLGLASVRETVELHGGSVEVESSRAGSRFIICVPNAMKPHALDTTGPASKRPPPSMRPPRSQPPLAAAVRRPPASNRVGSVGPPSSVPPPAQGDKANGKGRRRRAVKS